MVNFFVIWSEYIFFLHTVEGEYDWMKSILFKIYDTTMNTYVDDMIYGEENSR